MAVNKSTLSAPPPAPLPLSAASHSPPLPPNLMLESALCQTWCLRYPISLILHPVKISTASAPTRAPTMTSHSERFEFLLLPLPKPNRLQCDKDSSNDSASRDDLVASAGFHPRYLRPFKTTTLAREMQPRGIYDPETQPLPIPIRFVCDKINIWK